MQNSPDKTLPLWQVLICGAIIVSMAMGIRHGFGLWMQPMTQDMGWGREDFATAIGVQNISWGLVGIFSGMLADRFGAFRVMVVSALLYTFGLWGMANAVSPAWLALTVGVMVGAAQAGTT
ncbi:MAG: MFS transporter, partial [Limnohabitans sp.]|nr:MFS transporter [Limnohabitans sp.]